MPKSVTTATKSDTELQNVVSLPQELVTLAANQGIWPPNVKVLEILTKETLNFLKSSIARIIALPFQILTFPPSLMERNPIRLRELY